MSKNFFTKPLNILIIAAIATALWGSAIPAIKIGYELFGITESAVPVKLLFAGIRFFLAGLFVIAFNCIVHKSFIYPRRDEIKSVIALGLVQTTLEYIFFYLSLVYLTGVKGSILNSIGNFFAVIIAHFAFKDDRINTRKALGWIRFFIYIQRRRFHTYSRLLLCLGLRNDQVYYKEKRQRYRYGLAACHRRRHTYSHRHYFRRHSYPAKP